MSSLIAAGTKPVDIDLAVEGQAIAEVLAVLNRLPPYSIARVVRAVSGLVGVKVEPESGLFFVDDDPEEDDDVA